MKLTTYTREAIVRSICNDLPKPDADEYKKRIQAALVAAMSEPVRALYETVPNALASTPHYFSIVRRSFSFVVGDADYEEVFKPFLDECSARRVVEAKVADALRSCTTVKQVRDRFPEFDKYLPTEAQPTKNLPALVNVIPELVKAGWPKSKGSTE